MIKALLGVSIILLLSLVFNYAQYQKIVSKDLIIEAQEASIKDLNKHAKVLETKEEVTKESYSTVLKETKKSDNDFALVKEKLNEINCNKPEKFKNEVTSNYVDGDVAKYYNVLHTAYRLQNQH